MNRQQRLKKWEAALLAALCVTMLTGTWAQAKQTELASNLIRLHVVAASDDAAEQSVKLKVRDGVIAYLAPRLEGASDAAEAEDVISCSLDGIKAAAESRAGGARLWANRGSPLARKRTIRCVTGRAWPSRGKSSTSSSKKSESWRPAMVRVSAPAGWRSSSRIRRRRASLLKPMMRPAPSTAIT